MYFFFSLSVYDYKCIYLRVYVCDWCIFSTLDRWGLVRSLKILEEEDEEDTHHMTSIPAAVRHNANNNGDVVPDWHELEPNSEYSNMARSQQENISLAITWPLYSAASADSEVSCAVKIDPAFLKAVSSHNCFPYIHSVSEIICTQ